MLPASSPQLRLTCQPGKEGAAYIFRYRAENISPGPLLVMDAMPAVEAKTRVVSANSNASPVLLLADGSALLGKFIAPLPQDRRIFAPDLPLCHRLAPGEVMERELRLPLPFAETNPYFPDLLLRGYEPATAKGVILAVGFWPLDMPGIYAAPAAYAPALNVVAVTLAPVSAPLAWIAIPATKLEILRRKDEFPRQLKAHG